jgi:hypothetical protein
MSAMKELYTTLAMLSGESTVMVEELADNFDLIALIKQGKTYDELLEWVNENY